MTYKKIFLTLPAFMMATALTTSCSFEQDEYFDESASLRVTHQNENIKNRLVEQSAADKNGWVIQYFVSGTDDYNFEGFNLFGRFYKNGAVTLASDHRFLRNGNANKYTESNSYYDMLSEEGSVLSFNTWNDILTVFVDPVDPSKAPGSLVNDGEGMYGDQNLVLKKLTDDEMQFYGERHGAISRLIPCDRPWQQYIADTKAMKNHIATSTLSSHYVINDKDTMYFADLYKGLFVYGERITDPLQKKTLKCVFTPNGFRLERPDSLADAAFQEFKMSSDSTCLLNEDGKVKVVACWDNYILSRTTLWKIDYESMSSAQKSLYDEIAAELLSYSKDYVLESISLGRSSGGNAVKGVVITFYTNATKTKKNTAGVSLAISKNGYGRFLYTYDESSVADNNLVAIGRKAENLEKLVRDYAATLNGEYEVTPNDYFLPTGGEYKSLADGSVIKLYQ
jgi:hypothetical protein